MSDAAWSDLEAGFIARSQRGDQAAYGELVQHYHGLILGVALHLGADGGLAQDVAQETFLRAWRHLPRFEPRGQASFRAWLCRIAHNLAVDALRSQQQQGGPDAGQPDTAARDPDQDPDRAYARREMAEAVRASIGRLPPASQSVLILREYQGLSYAEIAHALGIPVGTVMSRLNYARGLLRVALAEYRQARSPD